MLSHTLVCSPKTITVLLLFVSMVGCSSPPSLQDTWNEPLRNEVISLVRQIETHAAGVETSYILQEQRRSDGGEFHVHSETHATWYVDRGRVAWDIAGERGGKGVQVGPLRLEVHASGSDRVVAQRLGITASRVYGPLFNQCAGVLNRWLRSGIPHAIRVSDTVELIDRSEATITVRCQFSDERRVRFRFTLKIAKEPQPRFTRFVLEDRREDTDPWVMRARYEVTGWRWYGDLFLPEFATCDFQYETQSLPNDLLVRDVLSRKDVKQTADHEVIDAWFEHAMPHGRRVDDLNTGVRWYVGDDEATFVGVGSLGFDKMHCPRHEGLPLANARTSPVHECVRGRTLLAYPNTVSMRQGRPAHVTLAVLRQHSDDGPLTNWPQVIAPLGIRARISDWIMIARGETHTRWHAKLRLETERDVLAYETVRLTYPGLRGPIHRDIVFLDSLEGD